MTVAAGPVDQASRSLGPDLARGVMLLAIALANSHYFLEGSSYLGGYPLDQGPLDRAVAWATTTFVDGRAFPMFGLLFGYGVSQIVRRQGDARPRDVRRLLWRRAGVLVCVGFLHAVLLFVGDILAAYGVLLLVGAWAVRWKDGWLLGVAAAFLVLVALPDDGALGDATGGPDVATMLPTGLVTMVVDRATASGFIALLGPVGFACPFLVGLWAGRRRLLEPPSPEARARRARGLLVVGLTGVAAAVVGAQPLALLQLDGRVPGGATVSGPAALHDATGVLGGFGYAALIALVALRLEETGRAQGRTVLALQAVGQRSMTCYLAQSVVWTLAFTPVLLGLSDDLTIAANAVLAVLTWLLTVALADWMRRTGRRGPFEVLVRQVTYR
ncbi:DUF418 domain-containing protein [Nocardioides sp. zg-1228]|uniref:DUF418 domain-containing protein n=1 Tax=Nocardioides sp. zg-1228 TaxID=2763008 RepID=UPI001643498A|nr:DUF418 domain-containing protein [Nocardioides sp. zg-1228]MBC2932416.1 DUF418 domain-containing protein [Nocardioides sp. zg-1228]QSF57928.1 DUF418 domain-containing protein [Nocardioides sp. zg-1228]